MVHYSSGTGNNRGFPTIKEAKSTKTFVGEIREIRSYFWSHFVRTIAAISSDSHVFLESLLIVENYAPIYINITQ